MDVSRQLKRFSDWKSDKAILDSFISDYDRYNQSLNELKDHEDASLLKKDLSCVFDIVGRWWNDPVMKSYFSGEFPRVIEFKDRLSAKLEQLRQKDNSAEKNYSFSSLDSIIKEQADMFKQTLYKPDDSSIIKNENISLLEDCGVHEKNNVVKFNDTYIPSLDILSSYFKDHGLVGDISTSVLSALGAINQLCFGIESFSGAGKTVSLDILLSLFPEDDVYILKMSSDKAVLYDAEKLNKKKIIAITELQKSANKNTIEVLKDLGEGKSSERIVTSKDRRGVELQEILNEGKYKKSVIYTKAVENWFKKDRELERRYFVLSTDVSKLQTKNVLDAIAQNECSIDSKINLSAEEERSLKNHLKNCLHNETEFINPFAGAISQYMPVTLKTRTFAKHYFNLIKACAKFHYPMRLNQEEKCLVALQDVYYIHELYSEQFVKSVLRVPFFGEKTLELFAQDENHQNSGSKKMTLSAEEIYRKIKPEESDVTYEFVKQNLNELVDAGFLGKSSYEDKNPLYFKEQHLNISDFKPAVDWNKVWKEGSEKMKELHSPELFDKWIKSQSVDGKITALNPYTNDKVVLVDLS